MDGVEAPQMPLGYVRIEPVEIGWHSYVGEFTHVSQHTVIGKFSSIGNLCTIGAQPHPIDQLTTFPLAHIWPEFTMMGAKTFIGNDVWIGSNCVVKAGITIGDGAVIGAGSVVTKNVEPYAVMVGNPAYKLRYRFDTMTRSSMQASRWWDLPDEFLRTLPWKDIHTSLAMIKEYRAVDRVAA